jgi:hypothetical protein
MEVLFQLTCPELELFYNTVCNNLIKKWMITDLKFLRDVPKLTVLQFLKTIHPFMKGTQERLMVKCKNSYYRKIVNVIAEALDLDHKRELGWTIKNINYDSYTPGCSICDPYLQYAENWHILGVMLSKNPLASKTSKDIMHKKHSDFQSRLDLKKIQNNLYQELVEKNLCL